MAPLIVARERLASNDPRQRQPEAMVMNHEQGVAEYDQAGATVELPLHHCNALLLSALLPEKGVLLDLGCGSGRQLVRLALGRPDVRIIGLDLSGPMLDAGRRLLLREGLTDRVELRAGDLTNLDGELPGGLSMVSCSFALHHLPTDELVARVFRAIRVAREQTGCALYLFDFVRLRNSRSWPAMMSLAVVPGSAFLQDGIASERAAFTVPEIIDLLQRVGLRDLEHSQAGPLGEYQLHWAKGRDVRAAGCWQDTPVPRGMRLVTRVLLRSFPRALIEASALDEHKHEL
jgi:SAM-dependent methyltransferase